MGCEGSEMGTIDASVWGKRGKRQGRRVCGENEAREFRAKDERGCVKGDVVLVLPAGLKVVS